MARRPLRAPPPLHGRAWVRRASVAVALALLVGLSPASVGFAAGVDGISDQSLPAWEGAFATSRLARGLAPALAAAPTPQVTMARYVVQWDAAGEPSAGPDAHGDYRERLEAWLSDVGQAGLQPVLALTSYDGSRPATPAVYASALQALLALAARAGEPIRYLEAWNEPNDQGREAPGKAAALADVAAATCAGAEDCEVIAGDLLDGPGALEYLRAYERALGFRPRLWGLHPYYAVKRHRSETLLSLRAALPGAGAGSELWFTEVGAYYCEQGVVRGEAEQAADAAYLSRLIMDPRLAPTHVFYDGLLYRDGLPAPCARGGGDDVELYRPDGRPRAAASILLAGMLSGAPLAFSAAVADRPFAAADAALAARAEQISSGP